MKSILQAIRSHEQTIQLTEEILSQEHGIRHKEGEHNLCPKCYDFTAAKQKQTDAPPITDLLKMSNVMRLCGYEGFAGGREAIEKAEAKESAEHKIITSPIFPPINVRGLDWCATFDGYEPGCPIGHGATEQEAIQDLKDKSEPDWKQLTPREELEDARTEARLDLQAEREDQESDYYSDENNLSGGVDKSQETRWQNGKDIPEGASLTAHSSGSKVSRTQTSGSSAPPAQYPLDATESCCAWIDERNRIENERAIEEALWARQQIERDALADFGDGWIT